MSTVLVYLLIAISSSNSSPQTLAVLNDPAVCARAANMLYEQAKDRRGSNNIYAYCIPVPAASLVK